MSRRHRERIVMLVIVMGPYCHGGIGRGGPLRRHFPCVVCLIVDRLWGGREAKIL